MTTTAWRQGARNALVCLVGIVTVCLAIAAVCSVAFAQPLTNSFGIAFEALLCPILLWCFACWLYGRSDNSRILLDCGPHPSKNQFLVLAVLFLVLGFTGGFGANALSPLGISGMAFGILFSVYWLIGATGRLQVRESGIWQYWSLLRWEKIASYRRADDSTLLIKGKGAFSFLRGALPVPPENRQAFEDLLAKYRPDADTDKKG